jgi:L-serine dehydratase
MCFSFQIIRRQSCLTFAIETKKNIRDRTYENEKSMRTEDVIHSELMRIWNHAGVHKIWVVTPGILPGGLNVRRRALICIKTWLIIHKNPQTWLEEIELPR